MQWFTSYYLKSHTRGREAYDYNLHNYWLLDGKPKQPLKKSSFISNKDWDGNKMVSPRPTLNTSLFAQSMCIVMGQVQENIKHKYLKSDWATGKSMTKKSINAGSRARIWRHELRWGYQKAASLHFFTQHLLLFNSTMFF